MNILGNRCKWKSPIVAAVALAMCAVFFVACDDEPAQDEEFEGEIPVMQGEPGQERPHFREVADEAEELLDGAEDAIEERLVREGVVEEAEDEDDEDEADEEESDEE